VVVLGNHLGRMTLGVCAIIKPTFCFSLALEIDEHVIKDMVDVCIVSVKELLQLAVIESIYNRSSYAACFCHPMSSDTRH